MSDSDATFVGNVTRDPEMRFTPSGSAVCNFGIAVNRKWRDKANEWQEETSFFNVQAWGTLAENVASSVTKGMRVVVKGRLNQRSWEGDDGKKNYAIELVADAIGPDLRYATADVAKVEREKGQQAAPQQQQQQQAEPDASWSEEPF